MRLRRDLGEQSTAGMVYRADFRVAGSTTHDSVSRRGGLWDVNTGRLGHEYGYRFDVSRLRHGRGRHGNDAPRRRVAHNRRRVREFQLSAPGVRHVALNAEGCALPRR